MYIIKTFGNGDVRQFHKNNKKKTTYGNYTYTDEERERRRKQKRHSSVYALLMSENMHYFFTLTTTNKQLAADMGKLLTCAARFFKQENPDIQYVCVAQNYEEHTPESDLFHIHGLSDKWFDVSEWQNYCSCDLDNLYCEEIYSTQAACSFYICRDLHRLPKGARAYRTNIKRVKPSLTILDDDGIVMFESGQHKADDVEKSSFSNARHVEKSSFSSAGNVPLAEHGAIKGAFSPILHANCRKRFISVRCEKGKLRHGNCYFSIPPPGD